jgi:thioesterase domain-containing protein
MGLRIRSWSRRGLWLSAPFARNANDKGTAFAGSLNAALMLAGWALVHLLLELEPGDFKVAITHGSIQYRRPIRKDIRAQCQMPDRDGIAYFLKTLRKRGKAQITLHGRVGRTRTPAVSFVGTYLAYPA